jgi:hypothetical protein
LDTEIEADLFQSRVTPFVKSLHWFLENFWN